MYQNVIPLNTGIGKVHWVNLYAPNSCRSYHKSHGLITGMCSSDWLST